MEKPKLYIHGDIAITCGDWKMPDSLKMVHRHPINDAIMADLMAAFKKAACKEYFLPDGTTA